VEENGHDLIFKVMFYYLSGGIEDSRKADRITGLWLETHSVCENQYF
jgi:hypothetical protein